MRLGENLEMLAVVDGGKDTFPTLLWDGREQILVDACFPQQFDRLTEAAAAAGRDIRRTTRLIFTHQDMDHIGCGREVREASPGLTVLAHEDEAPYIDGTLPPIKMADRMKALEREGSEEDRANVARMLEGYRNRTMTIDHPLKDGELLPWCGGIRVIHTPGHTPGHICLLVESCGILITGDALNIQDGRVAGPKAMHTKDMKQATETLGQLLDYDIRGIISYHHGWLEGDIRGQLKALLLP